MFVAVAIFGLATIVFGMSTSFVLSLAALFVTRAAVVVGGAGTCLVVLLGAYLFPELRALEGLTNAREAEEASSPTTPSPDNGPAASAARLALAAAHKPPDRSK
jgi:hypothetical protein